MPTRKNTEAALAEIRERTVWSLAHDAGCASPDSRDSAGAEFLLHVRDGVLELFERQDWADAAEFFDHANDNRWEISDGAPSIYTHRLFQQFVDLAAYHEDPSELGVEDVSDLPKVASTCLYLIADRLADSLIGEIDNALENDDADAEDEEGGA